MTTAIHRPDPKATHSSTCPAALSPNPRVTMASGEKRARSREKSGTSASTSAAVASVITGSDVAGQALRNAASRNAFDATWCASMMPAVLIATVVSAMGLTPPAPSTRTRPPCQCL